MALYCKLNIHIFYIYIQKIKFINKAILKMRLQCKLNIHIFYIYIQKINFDNKSILKMVLYCKLNIHIYILFIIQNFNLQSIILFLKVNLGKIYTLYF